jgi:hypothetical protein
VRRAYPRSAPHRGRAEWREKGYEDGWPVELDPDGALYINGYRCVRVKAMRRLRLRPRTCSAGRFGTWSINELWTKPGTITAPRSYTRPHTVKGAAAAAAVAAAAAGGSVGSRAQRSGDTGAARARRPPGRP